MTLSEPRQRLPVVLDQPLHPASRAQPTVLVPLRFAQFAMFGGSLALVAAP